MCQNHQMANQVKSVHPLGVSKMLITNEHVVSVEDSFCPVDLKSRTSSCHLLLPQKKTGTIEIGEKNPRQSFTQQSRAGMNVPLLCYLNEEH